MIKVRPDLLQLKFSCCYAYCVNEYLLYNHIFHDIYFAEFAVIQWPFLQVIEWIMIRFTPRYHDRLCQLSHALLPVECKHEPTYIFLIS